jgi:hypothetical protein
LGEDQEEGQVRADRAGDDRRAWCEERHGRGAVSTERSADCGIFLNRSDERAPARAR